MVISAFESWDVMFGMPIRDDNLAPINAFHQVKEDIDKTPALQSLHVVQKIPLTQSPLFDICWLEKQKMTIVGTAYIREFNSTLFWLLEIVCFIQFAFRLTQPRPPLKEKMVRHIFSLGGAQPKMQRSTIEPHCLGPFQSILSIGNQPTRNDRCKILSNSC